MRRKRGIEMGRNLKRTKEPQEWISEAKDCEERRKKGEVEQEIKRDGKQEMEKSDRKGRP